MKKRTFLAVALMLIAMLLCACAQSNVNALNYIESETVAETKTEPCLTEPATTEIKTTASTTQTTTTTTTEATTTTPEPFELTDEKVAVKIHDYLIDRGYTEAQACGVIGNAEVESGLEPSRGIPGGGFGLFQLMPCEQRTEMLEAMQTEGVGKYTQSGYWGLNASNFDTEDDMDKFLEIMLDYTRDEDDTAWQTELHNAQTPEEAAEIFLVHYERAIGGNSPIEYYDPYIGRFYQSTQSRRDAARAWYEYFSA